MSSKVQWVYRKISDLAEIEPGGTPSTAVAEYWNGNNLWATPTDITASKGKYISETARKISKLGLSQVSKLLPVGSILLCTRATIGEARINTVPITTNQGFKNLVPKAQICNEWLYYALQTKVEEMKSLSSGSTFLELGTNQLGNIEVITPDFKEQKAIAKAISDVDELVENLKLEKLKLENFKLAQIYLLMNPESLAKKGIFTQNVLLSNIASYLKGRGQNKSNLQTRGMHPCILYGELFTTYSEVIENVVSKSSKFEGLSSISGDVLIPGSTTTVGRDLATASVINENGILLGGDINIIRINKFEKLHPEYFAYLFQYIFVDQVEQMAQGTTIKHLYGKEIIKLNLDLPHVDYQIQVTETLSITEKRINSVEAELEKYESIKQGMAHDLLTGKVRLV